MELPRALVEDVSRYGPPERAQWVAELPRVVPEVARRWALDLGRPYQPGGVTSWVAPARRHGEHLVLKVTWTGTEYEESRHEADGLRVWDGRGTARLLDFRRAGATTALLLEACEPGTTLAEALAGPEQDVVVRDLLHRLWIDPPDGHPFRPLAQMCAWWADQAAAKGVPDEFRDGLDLFGRLPLTAPAAKLLLTDLHAENVLAAQREPWLVIDPKPYVGDPHYDALQHMLNCADRLHADPRAFTARMSGLLGLDEDRLRLWLYARCVQESPDEPQLLAVAQQLRP